MATWPPQRDDVKLDLKKDDARDDDVIERQLAAAVVFVQRVHEGRITFAGLPTLLAPAPDDAMWLGTVRLAARWYTRRRSPDGLVSLGSEFGPSRVSSFDPDIDRMLRIGRYAPVVIA